MAIVEKINFNVSPQLKRDLERLASSCGKNLSAFLISVCDQIVKANADRIKAQAQREQEPINFGNTAETPTKKTRLNSLRKTRKTRKTKPVAQVDPDGDCNA